MIRSFPHSLVWPLRTMKPRDQIYDEYSSLALANSLPQKWRTSVILTQISVILTQISALSCDYYANYHKHVHFNSNVTVVHAHAYFIALQLSQDQRTSGMLTQISVILTQISVRSVTIMPGRRYPTKVFCPTVSRATSTTREHVYFDRTVTFTGSVHQRNTYVDQRTAAQLTDLWQSQMLLCFALWQANAEVLLVVVRYVTITEVVA